MKEIIKLRGMVFIIIIILFFFPFFDVKCNNQKMYEFTGFELATGGKTIEYDGEEQKTEPNKYASLVLILALLSLIFSFIHNKISLIVTTIFSIAGIASMLLLYNDIRNKVAPPDSLIALEVNFFFPFYAVIILLLVYVVFSFFIVTLKKI
ncbi:MAG: hypothetical protein ABIN00_04815 [candidate division WOR-3 bacterium]